MDKEILNIIEDIEDEIFNLSKYICENPELGFEEFKAAKAHIDLLEKYGFQVEKEPLGFETAFIARYKGDKAGPKIGLMAEYDALPGIGHGCGHNALGAASTGAGIVLTKIIDEIGGEVIVYGTPAEETNGVKVDMTDAGIYDELDIAMMTHPAAIHKISSKSRTLYPIEFVFKGKTAHSAASPEKGINALDAVILTFNGINALREHVRETVKIHGIITEGGEAANIVPDRAVAQFYVRTPDIDYIDELMEKVINIAKGAALMTGAEMKYNEYEKRYLGLVTNQKLNDKYIENLQDLGITDEEISWEVELGGSLDMGNVSQVVPSIHPYFAVAPNEPNMAGHTVEMRDATLSEDGKKGLKEAIYALAKTARDVIEDEELLKEIKKEFNERFK